MTNQLNISINGNDSKAKWLGGGWLMAINRQWRHQYNAMAEEM